MKKIIIAVVLVFISGVAWLYFNGVNSTNLAIPTDDISHEVEENLNYKAGGEIATTNEEANKQNMIKNSLPTSESTDSKTATALLANGCFWCVEHDLEKVAGVIDVVSGYAGGTTENPTYEDYAAAGHREVVLVTYDTAKLTYANLVEHIIKHGDPTDSLGSFGDRGQAYAPAVYYKNAEEKAEALRVLAEVDKLAVFAKPLAIAVLPEVQFWPAEDYHQDYSKKNKFKYNLFRTASGRNSFIVQYWDESAERFTVTSKPLGNELDADSVETTKEGSWSSFVKPTKAELQASLTPIQFKVTQADGTEPPFSNSYDKNYTAGIYVDIVSGEPLFLSKDKYDSGTGWPSFVKPLTAEAVVLEEDNTFFSKRTEVRSRYADSHLGHVFSDGPQDRGGLRYCMNSAALRFIAQADMVSEGYDFLLDQVE